MIYYIVLDIDYYKGQYGMPYLKYLPSSEIRLLFRLPIALVLKGVNSSPQLLSACSLNVNIQQNNKKGKTLAKPDFAAAFMKWLLTRNFTTINFFSYNTSTEIRLRVPDSHRILSSKFDVFVEQLLFSFSFSRYIIFIFGQGKRSSFRTYGQWFAKQPNG
jgi:hypothetical protein